MNRYLVVRQHEGVIQYLTEYMNGFEWSYHKYHAYPFTSLYNAQATAAYQGGYVCLES